MPYRNQSRSLISHHESANQSHGKRLDTRGSCLTFTGLTTPLACTGHGLPYTNTYYTWLHALATTANRRHAELVFMGSEREIAHAACIYQSRSHTGATQTRNHSADKHADSTTHVRHVNSHALHSPRYQHIQCDQLTTSSRYSLHILTSAVRLLLLLFNPRLHSHHVSFV